MPLCDHILNFVKAELNHIYTEPPFYAPNGQDMGWFCREQALQLAAFAMAIGEEPEICIGDVLVRVPGSITISSVGTDSDHAWCSIGEAAPFDVSVTLRHFHVPCDDIQAVCGERVDCLSGFSLQYVRGASNDHFIQLAQGPNRIIAYNEQSRVAFTIPEILEDPFLFLLAPLRGQPSLQQIHGRNVFYAITEHLLKIARDEARPLYPYRTPMEAIRTIVRRNPDARAVVRRAIGAEI